jgi:hypothetical protein
MTSKVNGKKNFGLKILLRFGYVCLNAQENKVSNEKAAKVQDE